MFEDLTKAVSEFKKAKSILIFSPRISSVDKAVAIISLAKTCFKESKNFQIICPNDLPGSIKRLFSEKGLEINKEFGSKDYVVSVDYGSAGIEKVICKRDEDSKKLNFVITPQDELFNFDNVELISGSNNFDLIFSFGLDKLDEEIETLFENTSVISMTKRVQDEQKSYSEVVYEFIKTFSSNYAKEVLDILLQGIISKYKLFENGDNEGWFLVNKFIKYGADFNKAFRDLNYSKDCINLELQRKVMENVRTDQVAKVIWSKVELFPDLDEENLDLRGRIIFNISKDFDLAFVIYQLSKEKVKVVVESNETKKYSVLDLTKPFSGRGSKSRVVLTNKGMPADDFEKMFFEQMESIYDIKL